jgi:hypothetical protein
MRVSFCDYPLRLGVDDYDLSVARYAAGAAAIHPAIAVFCFGSVNSPGLSDIDLLCVLPDGLDGAACRRLVALTEADPLFAHGPVLLPLSMLALLPWISPGGSYRQVGGPALALGVAGGDDRPRPLHLASVIEGGLGRWIRLSQAGQSDLFHVRSACLRLWSLNHMVESASAAQVEIPAAARSFIGAMHAVRQGWAEQRRIDAAHVQALLGQSLPLFAGLMALAARAYVRECGLEGAGQVGQKLAVNRSVIWLGADDSAIAYRRKVFSVAGKSRAYDLLSLPRPLFQYYQAKSAAFPGATALDATLRRRAQAVGRHVEFLRAKGLPYDRMDGQGRTSGFALGRGIDRLAKLYLSRRTPAA